MRQRDRHIKRALAEIYPAREKSFVGGQPIAVEDVDGEVGVPKVPSVPAGWTKGAMLNVRATGAGWLITLFPEEYDFRHPEKSMTFTHYGQCQDFVSRWYAREHHDPRA